MWRIYSRHCMWSGGIPQVPRDCRGAAPKCTTGKNQASFWAQQRCEEIKALRRVVCVILWQGKALSEALAGRNGYLLTHGAAVLSHAGGSDPMRNRVIDFFVLLDIWPEWDLELLLQLLGCGCSCKELLVQRCFWRLLIITKKTNIKIRTFAVQHYIKSSTMNLNT